MVPPRLVRQSEAVDPRPAGNAPAATVELELDVDREGAVTAVRVTRSSGSDELDEVASAAARSFAFEPATRDGRPTAARIRYEHVFAAREVAPPPLVATAAVGGVALDRETGEPLSGADVVVTSGAGAVFRVKTDASGAFRVEGLPPGPVQVVVTAEGHVPERLDESLEPGTITEAKLRVERSPDPEAFVATARVEAPPREVTKRTLGREELTRVAGTRGDPLRAIELLPGVSRPAAFGGGAPILRGANPFDSQVFLEGAPVTDLYHLGGLTSFVHSRVLDTVDLYPSNFSVRYGRKVGGVIEARLRDPRTDGLHIIADASLLDSSLLLETPLGDKVSVLAAARRSNIDAVLNSAASTADLAITAAPVYWDYQAIAAWKPTDEDRLRVLAYGSSDRLAIVASKPSDVDPNVRGAFDARSVYHRVQLGYRHRFRGGSEQNTELTYGRFDGGGAFGSLGRSDWALDMVQGRSEAALVVSPALRVVAGLDVLANHFSGHYEGIPVPPEEGDQPVGPARQRRISIDVSKWVTLPGAYVEAGIRPIETLLITPGVRADYNDFIGRASIDPRLSARLDATERTALKAGVGHFSQSPDERQVAEPIGNPSLRMTRAIHTSAGLEHRFGDAVSGSVEGFAKWIDDVVASTPDGRAPYFVNSQEGRVFGGELMLRVRPSGRFFGFVAYTLMRSERRDQGGAYRLFDRDQPHILNASGAYRLGRGWELGATVRYTSGTPYTPVTSASYDATTDTYAARLGPPMSARNPAFSRIDVRVQKTWTFSRWSLAVYLDVQNILNSPNREGFSYSYDYRERQGARGLPIFPILGLRGEL